jgi:hypothetical protein
LWAKVEVWRRDRGLRVLCAKVICLPRRNFNKGRQKSEKIPWHSVALCEGGFQRFNDGMHK